MQIPFHANGDGADDKDFRKSTNQPGANGPRHINAPKEKLLAKHLMFSDGKIGGAKFSLAPLLHPNSNNRGVARSRTRPLGARGPGKDSENRGCRWSSEPAPRKTPAPSVSQQDLPATAQSILPCPATRTSRPHSPAEQETASAPKEAPLGGLPELSYSRRAAPRLCLRAPLQNATEKLKRSQPSGRKPSPSQAAMKTSSRPGPRGSLLAARQRRAARGGADCSPRRVCTGVSARGLPREGRGCVLARNAAHFQK